MTPNVEGIFLCNVRAVIEKRVTISRLHTPTALVNSGQHTNDTSSTRTSVSVADELVN